MPCVTVVALLEPLYLPKVSRLVENMVFMAPNALAPEHGWPAKARRYLTLLHALILHFRHRRTDHEFAHLQCSN